MTGLKVTLIVITLVSIWLLQVYYVVLLYLEYYPSPDAARPRDTSVCSAFQDPALGVPRVSGV